MRIFRKNETPEQLYKRVLEELEKQKEPKMPAPTPELSDLLNSTEKKKESVWRNKFRESRAYTRLRKFFPEDSTLRKKVLQAGALAAGAATIMMGSPIYASICGALAAHNAVYSLYKEDEKSTTKQMKSYAKKSSPYERGFWAGMIPAVLLTSPVPELFITSNIVLYLATSVVSAIVTGMYLHRKGDGGTQSGLNDFPPGPRPKIPKSGPPRPSPDRKARKRPHEFYRHASRRFNPKTKEDPVTLTATANTGFYDTVV